MSGVQDRQSGLLNSGEREYVSTVNRDIMKNTSSGNDMTDNIGLDVDVVEPSESAFQQAEGIIHDDSTPAEYFVESVFSVLLCGFSRVL